MRLPTMLQPGVLSVLSAWYVAPALLARGDDVKPRAGLVIGKDARIAPGTHPLPTPDGEGAVMIQGDGITVDFAGATLVGADEGTPPDRFTGRGIVIHGQNVTLKHATVRGYKVGIYAEDAPGLTITGCDVSRNFRQHLKSTPEREDPSDWLYGHDNDDNEWLRYGAGIYLFRCPGATVRGCRARNGQNGLCLVRCDGAYVADNDMSFMSGWGLAMWRSSRCDIMGNRFDFCIRGYSHGVYARGQDSAGILVYEQCSHNVFAYNSATHGGDGFFLYAGNETLKKTGHGGCNDNLVYNNDFSYAAANGIEATFSGGNVFSLNTMNECEHGVWAGYSYDTWIVGGVMEDCTTGVSIEHGQRNVIAGTHILNATTGVHLWWDDDPQLRASPFVDAHDGSPSESNTITQAGFDNVKTAIRLEHDTNTEITSVRMKGVDTSLHLVGDVYGLHLAIDDHARASIRNASTGGWLEMPRIEPHVGPVKYPLGSWDRVMRRDNRTPPAAPENPPRGRRYIFVDEWGPYDFTDVRMVPDKVTGVAGATIRVLGPVGTPYQITGVSGGVTLRSGPATLPAELRVDANADGFRPFSVTVRVQGKQLTTSGTLLRAD
ncbi:MAG: nitrous oxide reductase family maturation protein NosD, partial [Phycisphaerae bacterium]